MTTRRRYRLAPAARGILALLCILMLHARTHAAPYSRPYRGVRPLGMGGAFTAVADDENAIFYNPAGLARTRSFDLGLINPLLEVGENGMDLAADIDDTELDDTGEVANLMRDYAGEPVHLRFAMLPYVRFPAGPLALEIGALAQVDVDVSVRNPAWPEAHVNAVVDGGGYIAGGGDVPVEGLSVGAGLKFIVRNSLDAVYTPAVIASDGFEDVVEDDLVDGSGLGADLGALYLLPIDVDCELRVGAAILNVPSMDLGDARDIDTQVNLGFSAQKDFEHVSLIGAIDLQDAFFALDQDDDLAKRLHIGGEVAVPVLSVQAGLHQGYMSAGVGLDLKLVRLEAGTYAEEVGAYSGQHADRRYVVQITMGW